MKIKNLPATETIKTWVVLSVRKDGSFSYFYSDDKAECAASCLEWHDGDTMVMVHKNALKSDEA